MPGLAIFTDTARLPAFAATSSTPLSLSNELPPFSAHLICLSIRSKLGHPSLVLPALLLAYQSCSCTVRPLPLPWLLLLLLCPSLHTSCKGLTPQCVKCMM